MKKLLLITFPLLLASGCAYDTMYAQYAASCASRPQAKLAQFTDSGGKPVTVYGSNGCGVSPPENNAKYAASIANKALSIAGIGIVAHEVGSMVTDVSKMSGTRVSADGESTVTVSVGDGSFNRGDIGGDINVGNVSETDTNTISTDNSVDNSDNSNPLLGP